MANAVLTPAELPVAEEEETERVFEGPAIVEAIFEEEEVAPPKEEKPFEPRVLTAAIRKQIGLPAARVPPYRFAFSALMVTLVGIPMLMLGWFKTTGALAFIALGFLPFVRGWERREIALRDRVYTHGREVVARVLDVEPGGPDRGGKVIRVQFMVQQPTPRLLDVSVFGCPLARKGLEPGDDVVVVHDPEQPLHALVIERVARSKPKKVVRRPVPKGCGNGG
ncbi:MAG: hypothetical protein ACXVEF_38580, partial [Polyangiales bacterium]